MQLNENRIREYAYQIWESEGKPDGRAQEHWNMACKSLEADSNHQSNHAHAQEGEHHLDNFIPHQNTKKGKHAHHSHHPQPH